MTSPGTLPTDFYQTGDVRKDLDRLYRLMQTSTSSILYGDSVIQTLGSADVKIIGNPLGGVGTYDYQVGRIIRYGQHVHYWFSLKWTAFSISGPGNFLCINLPFPSIDMGDFVGGNDGPGFVGHAYGSGFVWTGTGNYLSFSAQRTNLNIAKVKACLDGVTASDIVMPNSGILAGYISYITS